ncbi:hypothetical protein MPTK1_8g09020 [Marchantia polymorpha subsp. ruderalis]|uniref:Secreted protein n=1 Tax=Marchantia polymorpha TaxID=3197 RepID=A0A2R6WRI1_MARPO|nr:hypothetical protein MARPO_0063s0017 [Marchantia polymorpha]BBN19243.1 hypothetical protein Mp_8g09020 [Marchantia polymorpha subsp. ruderalis]|eukprot:PTQ36469.1 hypothetical protein MARPO_0063s0017 [Marchantia polymorpha]
MSSNLVFLLFVSVLLSFQLLCCCSSRPLVSTPDVSSHLQYLDSKLEPTEVMSSSPPTEFDDHGDEGTELNTVLQKSERDEESQQISNTKSGDCEDDTYYTPAALPEHSESPQIRRHFVDLSLRRSRLLQRANPGKNPRPSRGPVRPGKTG